MWCARIMRPLLVEKLEIQAKVFLYLFPCKNVKASLVSPNLS